MSKQTGAKIKEARTNAHLTQQQLAERIFGLSANDISKAERGEKDLTQDQLKAIAKATGVTQKSLLETVSSSKPSSSKTSSASVSTVKVTAAEKRFLELYRKASTEDRKAAIKTLKGEGIDPGDIIENLIGSAMETLLKK